MGSVLNIFSCTICPFSFHSLPNSKAPATQPNHQYLWFYYNACLAISLSSLLHSQLHSFLLQFLMCFLLFTDVNEWNNNYCSECSIPSRNIYEWFTYVYVHQKVKTAVHRYHPEKKIQRKQTVRPELIQQSINTWLVQMVWSFSPQCFLYHCIVRIFFTSCICSSFNFLTFSLFP